MQRDDRRVGGADDDGTLIQAREGKPPDPDASGAGAPGTPRGPGPDGQDREGTLLMQRPDSQDADGTFCMPRPGAQDPDRTLFMPAPADPDPDRTLLMPRPRAPQPRRAAPPAGEDADRTLLMPRPRAAHPDPTLLPPVAAGDADRTLLPPAAAGDADRTQRIRPVPGPATATAVLPRRGAASAPRPGAELQRLVAGINPLLNAAGVLLGLVAQLRATTAHADPVGLRSQLLARVADFESRAAAQGVPRPKISAARYVLCTFLDETIAATPWGADGVWARRNLLQEFHDERDGGVKAFELLDRLGEDPQANTDVLELFYVCITLGFEGRFKGVPGGRAQLDAIAARVLEVVHPGQEQRQARTISQRWQGVAAPGRRVNVLPLWVVFAVAGAAMLAVVLGLNRRLDEAAVPVFRQLHLVPAALRLEPPPSAAPRARVAPRLSADVASGALTVRDETLRSVITLPADALFGRAGARIEEGQEAVLARVARALQGLPGEVTVVGHTDDAPVTSLQFPSGWHLSQARARAVADALVAHGERPARVTVEGRGDAEPLAPNTSDGARARNRRIEIELRLPRPEG